MANNWGRKLFWSNLPFAFFCISFCPSWRRSQTSLCCNFWYPRCTYYTRSWSTGTRCCCGFPKGKEVGSFCQWTVSSTCAQVGIEPNSGSIRFQSWSFPQLRQLRTSCRIRRRDADLNENVYFKLRIHEPRICQTCLKRFKKNWHIYQAGNLRKIGQSSLSRI